jgi:hypothetical protein
LRKKPSAFYLLYAFGFASDQLHVARKKARSSFNPSLLKTKRDPRKIHVNCEPQETLREASCAPPPRVVLLSDANPSSNQAGLVIVRRRIKDPDAIRKGCRRCLIYNFQNYHELCLIVKCRYAVLRIQSASARSDKKRSKGSTTTSTCKKQYCNSLAR